MQDRFTDALRYIEMVQNPKRKLTNNGMLPPADIAANRISAFGCSRHQIADSAVQTLRERA